LHIRSDRLLVSAPMIAFLYRLVRTYSRTFRLQVINEREWMAHVEKGGSVLLCGWHQQFFSVIRHFQTYRRYHPSLMISRSRDGEIIAGVAERTGWHAVRGSSSRGGRNALKQMIRELKGTCLAGHIVDGPRGPAGVVKPGAVRLAHLTGSVIVPFYVAAERSWQFNSWDRFLLPKPFSRVQIRFGEMLRLPRVKDGAAFESQRRLLEETMRPGLIV
jgi:lysophospholipid acyltransferase (LPLAT)-like uncharacterized protein